MALDPLSALGLASNIVQFVDFTAKLVSKGHKIYQSDNGTLIENDELEATTRKIIDLNNRVVDSFERSPHRAEFDKTDRDIKDICISCNKIAEQLLKVLETLKPGVRHSKWHSFRQALKSVWTKEKIEKLKAELDGYRKHLDTTLLVSLRSSVYPQMFRSLADESLVKKLMKWPLSIPRLAMPRARIPRVSARLLAIGLIKVRNGKLI